MQKILALKYRPKNFKELDERDTSDLKLPDLKPVTPF